MHWNDSLATGEAAFKRGRFNALGSTKTAAANLSVPALTCSRIRNPTFVFLVMVALSLPMRFGNLQAPFSGEHEFRQTQTALSVWEIREHGFSLLHPRLPLFGPPWECPFEYPVFQIVAAAVDSIAPWTNLDVSIRVTNLLFFYLTAAVLVLVANLFFEESEVALFAAAVFLFSPYNAFWSRASMIEYAATFFGLAYLLILTRWILQRGRKLFALALGLGILGSLTKTTSFAIPLVTAGAIVGLSILKLLRHQWPVVGLFARLESCTTKNRCKSEPQDPRTALRPVHVLALVVLLVVPVLAGYFYTRYGDHIKGRLPYTALLSLNQSAMKRWTYGTWEQRLSWHNWERILWRMEYINMPSLAFAALIGFCALPFCVCRSGRWSPGSFWLGLSLAVAPLVGIAVFFNLYVIHTYYLIACSPFLALFAGVGLSLVFKFVRTRFLQLLFLLFLIGLGLEEWSGRLGASLASAEIHDQRVAYLSDAAQLIKKDEPVIVLSSSGWSAFAPYYLKRRAFMLMPFRDPVILQPLLDQRYFKNNGFHWLLTEGDAEGMPELTTQLTNQWKFARVVPFARSHSTYTLYSLSDE